MTFAALRAWCGELAEALAYAHEQGIVHRDVKPANVMVDAQDRVHLMDFGLAARADDASQAKLTSDGAVMGTPSYMAPEQARGQQGDVKPAADQYACGVVLYELLTGRTPFTGPVTVVLHNVIHTEPERPGALRTGLQRDLETICLKAMSKHPQDRYVDCQELADDLRRWLEGEPIAAMRLSLVERLARWLRKNPAAAMAGGLTAVAVGSIAVALALLSQYRNEHRQRGIAESATQEARSAEATAEEERGKAIAARNDEQNQRKQADLERTKAIAAYEKADISRKEAEKQHADAEKARKEAENRATRSGNSPGETGPHRIRQDHAARPSGMARGQRGSVPRTPECDAPGLARLGMALSQSRQQHGIGDLGGSWRSRVFRQV